MISKTMTAVEIESLLQALKGSEGDGLAYRKLPVGKVVLPLLRFVQDAVEVLKPITEARGRLAQDHQAAETPEARAAIEQEFQTLMNTEFSLRLMPICQSCLNDRDDLSLADLQALSTFFPEQDPSE